MLFTGTDLVSGTMSRIRKNFDGLEDQAGVSISGIDTHLNRLAGGLATAAVGAGALMAAFGLASAAEQFELAIAQVGAVSGATREELEMLKQAAIEAGISTEFTPEQATLALNELAQAGFSAQESIGLLRPALDLAAGSLGQLSPQESAGVAAQALKAFGIETGMAKVAVDQMLQASNAFAMRADDLPLALGIASRGAQSLNQSLTETIIAVGLVKNVIPGTERAATAVAVAMERMVKTDTQRALKKIGVQVVDSEGNFREFLSIIEDLAPALDKMTVAQRGKFLQETFGAESLAGLNAILGQVSTGLKTSTGETVKGAEAIAFLRQQFRGANGVAEEFSKKLLDTAAGQKKLLRGSLETLAVVAGESFSQALRPAVELTIRLVNGLIGAIQRAPKWVKKLGVALFLFGSVLLLVVGALITLGAVFPLLAAGFALVKGAMIAMGLATAGALVPLLPWIAGALVVGAAVYYLTGSLGDAGKAMLAVGAAMFGFFAIPKLVAMLSSLATAFRVVGAAMLANPLGLLITALSLIVLLIAGIRNNWFGLRDAFVSGIAIIAEKLEFLKAPLEFFRDLVAGEGPSGAPARGRSIDSQFAADAAEAAAAPPQQEKDPVQAALDAMNEIVPTPLATPAPGPLEDPAAALAEPTIQAAAQAAQEEAPAGPAIDYTKLAAAVAAGVEKRPMTTVLQVDGETIATAAAAADRSRRERGGEQVPEEAR